MVLFAYEGYLLDAAVYKTPRWLRAKLLLGRAEDDSLDTRRRVIGFLIN